MAVDKFGRALNLREYLLQDFIQLIVVDWKMNSPERAKNKQFVHGVRQKFEQEGGK